MFGRKKKGPSIRATVIFTDGSGAKMKLKKKLIKYNIDWMGQKSVAFEWDADKDVAVEKYIFEDAIGNFGIRPDYQGSILKQGDTLCMTFRTDKGWDY